jgi:hypothetical protein
MQCGKEIHAFTHASSPCHPATYSKPPPQAKVTITEPSAVILEQSNGARNRVGIGLSYRPARLHRLQETIPSNRLGSLKVQKFGLRHRSFGIDSLLPTASLCIYGASNTPAVSSNVIYIRVLLGHLLFGHG